MSVQHLLSEALQHHQRGDLAAAEKRYREILTLNQDDPDALHLLGVIAHQVGKNDLAVNLIRSAIQQRPQSPEFYNNLGQAWQALERFEDAIAAHRQAIALRPEFAEAHNNLGNALKALGRYSSGVSSYKAAIQLRPSYLKAFHNLGISLRLIGESEAAADAFRRTVELDPTWVEGHICLGDMLKQASQHETAIAAYRAALALSPNAPAVENNLALALRESGRLEEAIATIKAALRTKPDFVEAQFNLATLLREQGDFAASIAIFSNALAQEPVPAALHSGFLFILHYDPHCDAAQLLARHRQWAATHAAAFQSQRRPHRNDANPDRRLRIGYVSADLREHPVGRNIHPLLAHHDHREFEVYAYAQVDKPDSLSDRLRQYVDHWRDAGALTDDQLAEQIRHDEIDILIDLSLHTEGNRLLVFARKPAPVQVTFAGYPSTTGLDSIDYRLTDPFLDPPGTRDEFYTERSFRLPHSFWCFDPIDDNPTLDSKTISKSDPITWGCLGNPIKINARVLDQWAKILRASENSRLVVLAHNSYHRERIATTLGHHGVESDRIEFVPKQPRPGYLEVYRRCHVILDTFPYNGHTTACDALWMGVPVVTLTAKTAVGRGGFSLLCNLGLADLATQNEDDYVRIALNLAHDRDRLGNLHATLHSRMQDSPLMDAPRFARHIESAYRSMWHEWCLR